MGTLRPMRWLDKITRRTVVLHMTTGQSLRGVLVGVYSDSVVLNHAVMLGGDSVAPLDGEIVIPRERVGWLQTLRSEGVAE